MKPSSQQIMEAAARLTALAMYPTNPAAHAEIMRLLQRMVPHAQALDWLVTTMIDRVGEWKGTAELRGLLCTRFKPADGVEAYCSLAGFTPADSESQTLLEHEDRERIETSEHRAPLEREITELAKQKRVQ